MKKLKLVEALEAYEHISEYVNISLFVTALIISLLASFAASFLYWHFYETRGTGSQISKSFPLLGLSITTLFICIQISIPLSLGLMGSLSIIRFRTPIKEPEEVGFILLVIASSVASATYNFQFLLCLYILAFISLFIIQKFRSFKFIKRDGMLVVSFADENVTSIEALTDVLKQHIRKHSLQNVSNHNGTTSYQITFSGLLTDVAKLQRDIQKKLRTISINIFLDRPGGWR